MYVISIRMDEGGSASVPHNHMVGHHMLQEVLQNTLAAAAAAAGTHTCPFAAGVHLDTPADAVAVSEAVLPHLAEQSSSERLLFARSVPPPTNQGLFCRLSAECALRVES